MLLQARIIAGSVFATITSQEVKDAFAEMNTQVKAIVRDRDNKIDVLKQKYKSAKAKVVNNAKKEIKSAREDFKNTVTTVYRENVNKRLSGHTVKSVPAKKGVAA